MAIAKDSCEIIEYDSTVECLAQYILNEAINDLQGHQGVALKVMAFEGVGKGAIISNEQ